MSQFVMRAAAVRRSGDGALAVRNAPTRRRADGLVAPWSVVYAPATSGYDSPAALTETDTAGWTDLVPTTRPATGRHRMPMVYGPLEVAPRSVWPPYDRHRSVCGPAGTLAADHQAALSDALHGVELGAYDRRIVGWLAGCDVPTVGTVCSWLHRAHAAGRVGGGGRR
jgi:hypothetical protein